MAFNVTGQPKTVSGKRWVSFPTFLFEMLKQHQARQIAFRDTAKKWIDHDLVFPNLSGGYLHPNHMGRNLESS